MEQFEKYLQTIVPVTQGNNQVYLPVGNVIRLGFEYMKPLILEYEKLHKPNKAAVNDFFQWFKKMSGINQGKVLK